MATRNLSILFVVFICSLASNSASCQKNKISVSTQYSSNPKIVSFQLKDYLLVVSAKRGYVIHEKSLKIEKLDIESINKIIHSKDIEIKRNVLFLKSNLKGRYTLIEVADLFENTVSSFQVYFYSFLILLVISFVFGYFFLFQKQKRNRCK